jgi:alpha-D-ribose 1-methylphosphonate 5-triphosphate synthase subunit PhnH
MIEAVSGLEDVAIDSAIIFRASLDALAHPGRIVAMTRRLDPPAPLYQTTAALGVTLCDFDTPMWIAPELYSPAVADYMRFRTGVPIRNEIAGARFLFCNHLSAVSALMSADRGTAEYPDRSATLIIQVDSFDDPSTVALSGPGIANAQPFAAARIGEEFWRAAAANHVLYPLGADFIFASPDAIAGLPRSAAIVVQR